MNPRAVPGLPAVPALLALVALAGCAFAGVATGPAARILLPMACAAAIGCGFLAFVIRRGGGSHAVLELGPVYAAVVVVYTVYPLLGFLFNGLRYGELSDNRLFAIQPDARDVARLAWFYVVHLGGFAVAYVAARGPSGEVRLGETRVSRFAVVVVGGLWLLVQAYFMGLERVYDWHFETNLDRYVALANLPLLLAQVTGHLGAIRFTLEVALLVMLYAYARRPLLFVVPWLAFVAAMTLSQHQSRTELVLLTFTAVVCFHLQVRPLSAVLLSTFAAAGIVGFLYLGATRDTFGALDVDPVPRLFVANEFESIFGNAFDLDQRVRSGEVRALPATFFLADVLAPVPQQLLGLPKVFPADWYMRSFFPADAERGVGLCFGTISEAVVGGGLPDALARGAALGLVFGAIHRFVSRRRPGLWWFVFYVWLTVMAYNSFRMTTFHLLVRTVYDFLPVVLVVKAASIGVGLARREFPGPPGAADRGVRMPAAVRVLHLIPNMLSGGAQQQLTYLAGEQRRLGRDVHVSFLHDGPKSTLLGATGAAIHRLNAAGNHDPFLFSKIRSLIGRVAPDVVQTWLLQMDVLGGAAARWTGVPWVLCERGATEAHLPGLKNGLRAWLARGADAIVSNSLEGDRYWETRADRPLRRVVRNGIPLEAIGAAVPASNERLGLREGERMILYAGRLSPEKNLENLIPALGAATEANAAVAFLCGDGTHQEEARALVARLGLSDRVRLIGYVEDVWSWMKRADVFVSISHYEGHPNTVLEAAACGTPLVLSAIPQHLEILDASAAVLVDRFDPAAVAQALTDCLRDPGAARTRADAARRAVAPLSIGAMARQYDDVYRDVLARRGRSA